MYYIIHTIYNVYTKAFLLCLIKAWERTLKEKEKVKLENKLNGSNEYETEKVKQAR